MSNCPKSQIHHARTARWGYAGLGLLSTALGVIGAFLPVMPTTCFLLISLWAFSKSSPQLHQWLWNHPTFGGPLQRWQRDRCIPLAAKAAALVSMAGSMTFVLLFADLGWIALSATAGFLGLGAFFVLRAPSFSQSATSEGTSYLPGETTKA